MNPRYLDSARSCALAGAVVLALTGCGSSGSIPTPTPDHRPTDALLTNTELQHVVELQVQRDGAGLTELLTSPRSDVRARAALALGSVPTPGAVPALITVLGDTSAAVRRDAAFALGQANDTAAVAPLVAAYGKEDDAEVRHRIMEALGKVPSLRGPAAILGMEVRRDEEADRTMALARLGALRGIITEDVLVYLLRNLTNDDPAVRRNAAYFVGRVRTSAPWTDRAGMVRDALASYSLDDPAAMYLSQGLARQGDQRNGEPLRHLAAASTDWRVRANATAALGPEDPHDDVTSLLLHGLDDPSIHVAVNAATSLSQRPPLPSDLPKLEAWIDAHPDRWQVAGPLLVLLARADEREYVFKWLDALSLDDEARWGIGLNALAFVQGEEGLTRLTTATGAASPRVAGDAARALARHWRTERSDRRNAPIYFPLFSEALRRDQPRVTYILAPVMADSLFLPLGGLDTLKAAYRRMSPPDGVEAMQSILSALASTGDRSTEPFIREALSSDNAAVRREAAGDLARLNGDTLTVEPDAPGGTGAEATAAVLPDPLKLDWAYLAQLGVEPRLVLETNRGKVVVRLDTDEAPLTVQTVARLAEAGKYDGVPFHRVISNFVVQTGDFTNRDGTGNAGFTIETEATLIPFLRGVIGMAREPRKDTEDSQFFITHSMQPHLSGDYTAFGWVVKGMDVVDRIAQGDTLVHASIERGG